MSIKRYKDIASMQNPGKQRTGKAGGGRVGADNGGGIFGKRRTPEKVQKRRDKWGRIAKHPVTKRVYKAVTPGIVQDVVSGVKDLGQFVKERRSDDEEDTKAATVKKEEEKKPEEKKKKSARGGRISRAKGGIRRGERGRGTGSSRRPAVKKATAAQRARRPSKPRGR